jgi:polar amino acid transport system permease protein
MSLIPNIKAIHGRCLAPAVMLVCSNSFANSPDLKLDYASTTLGVVFRWLPAILQGFGFDVLISFAAIFIGTLLGLFLGISQISKLRWISIPSRLVTQFFRNAPWLVILFFCIYLFPFEVVVFGTTIMFPAWLKCIFGLSLPVMGNISEVVRGGIQSIPAAQWEAAESLGLTYWQALRLGILPQAIKRMMAPWMNTYAILMMSTPLVSVVGVDDSVRVARQVLSAEGNPALMMPIFLLILILYFCYCAPIAVLTQRVEKYFQIK